MDSDLLSTREVADYLRINDQTVRGWARRGLFPVINMGGAAGYRMRLADVLAYLATRQPPTRGRPRKRTGAGDGRNGGADGDGGDGRNAADSPA